MANTTKKMSLKDDNQTSRTAFNDVDASVTINGFLVGQVGHQVTLAISTTTLSNDTETYSFLDNGNPLYQIQVIYTDGTRGTLLSATRIS